MIPSIKRLMVAGLLVALSAGAEAKVWFETVKTPVGLEIKFVGVHDKLPEVQGGSAEDVEMNHGRYGTMTFTHGNLTLRLSVDNPTATPQPLTVEFPFLLGYGSHMRNLSKRSNCIATRTIPPGKGNPFELSLPHIGMMSDICSIDVWKFTDASGKTVDGKDVLTGGQGRNFQMPMTGGQYDLFNPSVAHLPSYKDFVIAASRSFRGAPELAKRVHEHKRKKNGSGEYEVDVNRPDFTRMHDWRDLACYDALVFTTNDWNECSDDFRACAKDYEAAGGKVIFADGEREIELTRFIKGLESVAQHLRGYGCTPVYESDRDSMLSVRNLKNETPFGSIILVLLVFVVIAGPVTIFILAKFGKRIHLLWVFPSIAIVFSVAVALTIVFANGLDVKVTTFSCEVERAELGRKVVVKNRVYVAPFPMDEAIRCSKSALVTVDSGTDQSAGEYIVSTTEDLQLVGNWTPCLWPVRVREVEVVRTEKEGAK